MSTAGKPMPDLDDPVTAPYWAATRESRLVVPRSNWCGTVVWPPEPVCPVCLRTGFRWEDVEPTGALWSYAVYHRALDPAFADAVPYAVGLVELSGGIKMYGTMRGPLDSLAVGRPVTAVFEPVTAAVTFVRWRVT